MQLSVQLFISEPSFCINQNAGFFYYIILLLLVLLLLSIRVKIKLKV